jgi:hypothetical protein
MPNDPQMRASDADRDRVAALLREHHAVGRLDVEEFQERLDNVYAAKTLGQLDELMADLPGIDLYQLPDASMRVPPAARTWTAGGPQETHLSAGWRAAWGSWVSVSLICFTIWLVSAIGSPGNFTDPWFLFIAGPWGAVLLGRWLLGAPAPGRPPRGRLRTQGHQLRGDLPDPSRRNPPDDSAR